MVTTAYNIEIPHKEIEVGIQSAVDTIKQVTGKEARVIEKNPDVSLRYNGDLTILNNKGLPTNLFIVETTNTTDNPKERVAVSVKTK